MKTELLEARDYSLVGKESTLAIERGLAEATWYTSPVPRDKMRELLKRKNGPAIRDTIIWFGLILGSGYLMFLFWGTWWFVAPFLLYSVLYASTSDSRWHEAGHGTAFKTDWMNNFLYRIASFMVTRQSTVWRWSHTRHHSDTIIRGRDPEIAAPRPPDIKGLIMNLFALKSAPAELKKILVHASGRIDPEVATFLPKTEYRKVFWEARLYLLIYAGVIGLSVYFWTLLPLMFIGISTLAGSWLLPVYGLTQHAGLEENVLDHRLNCRTVYMNRVNRFLYWNMNYHLEHHMFPLVPYHALPKLHEYMKDDCPTPYNGIIEAYKEIIPALIKQVKDPSYHVKRHLPTPSKRKIDSISKKFIGTKVKMNGSKLVEVCSLEEIPENEVVRFDYKENTYAVYRTAGDEFHATEGICTHGSTHLADGLIIGGQIECPKHNGRFKITDGSVQRPPVCTGLKTFPVKKMDGKIYLDVENPGGAGLNENIQEFTFKVVSNKNVATFIKELVLAPLNNENFTYKPGEYLQLIIPPFESTFQYLEIDKPFHKTWKNLNLFKHHVVNLTQTKRNYSMASNPDRDKQLRFNVRISLPPPGINCNAGIGSSHVFGLKPGDEVKAIGPFGDFHIKDTREEMIYLGGGAGMAPLRSHIAYLFETLKTKRKVSFWYGARSLQELFYNDYFEQLDTRNENFSFHVALSEPMKEDKWTSHTGFIHEVFKKEYLEKMENNKIKKLEFYLCGPPALIQAASTMLVAFGVSPEQIAFDEF